MESYWVPDEEFTFIPCVLESRSGKDAVFRDADKNKVVYPSDKLDSLGKVIDAQLVGVDNICTLEEVNQAALLHTIRVRYKKEQIYTRVARILVAVNPFKGLPIFSAQHLQKYLQGSDSMDMPPHIYGIGLDAISGLRAGENKNQAVLISGESGAGKTESTKLVLSYVAEGLGGSDGGIQDKIMRTNPVLEAFGNAMTVRNNNSSRFGKWLQMMVTPSQKVKGCAVVDYLLELTRVCSQGEKERNYHIFFMLISSKTDALLSDLAILQPEGYAYCKDSQFKAPGVDDVKCFEELKDALEGLGYSVQQQKEIFGVTMGILALGNVDFTESGEAAEIADESALAMAATLLGMSTPALREAMVIRKIAVGKDVTEARRNTTQARAARDGLARLMYGRLFKWLIAGINSKLSEGADANSQFFGVLDIAGFESFEVNSLEQLFINLSNEHLQLHFNNHIFKMELDDYKAEQVDVDSSLTFQDNSDVVNLLDSKGAILSILDEEVSMPKASDQTFLAKVFKAHGEHKRLIVPKFAGAMKFGIRHFAGDVNYTGDGFLEKNVDKPPDEAPALFKASSLSVLAEVGVKIAEEVAEASNGSRGKKVKTVSSGFRASLASLVGVLGTAEPHFIRCIKPNAEKVPSKFTSKLVMEQLLSSGVFEAVRIRQSGFASRIPFKEFLSRFKLVVPKDLQQSIVKAKQPDEILAAASAFKDALPTALSIVGGFDEKSIVLGKSKVFAKTAVMNQLEHARDLVVVKYAVNLQRIFRGNEVRKKVRGAKAVFKKLGKWWADNNFYTAPGSKNTAVAKHGTPEKIRESLAALAKLLVEAEKLPLEYPKMKMLMKVKNRMENEANVLKQFKDLSGSIEPVEIEAALKRAKDLELQESAHVIDLTVRVQRLKAQIPLAKAMQKAVAEESLPKLQEVMDQIRKANLHQKPEDWIAELKGETIASEVFNLLEELKAKQKLEDIEKKRKAELQKQLEEEKEKHEVRFADDEKKLEEEQKAKRKATITGFSVQDQERVKLALLAACHEFDVEALEVGLAEATEQGMEESDQLKQAQELFENLQTEAYITSALEEQTQKLSDKEQTMHTVKCIKNIAQQAGKLSIATQAADDAKKAMQDHVRRRARTTIRAEILFKVDMDEFELVQDAFSDLNNFPGLKPVDKWRGHKAAFFMSTNSDPSCRLKHSKKELRDALTKVPPLLERQAVNTFRSILSWMSDRPMPDCQRLGYTQDIVDTAKCDPVLADETYVQIMKQLTDNPSKRSEGEGWKLLLMLCQQVRPSQQLDDFLHTFLLKASKDSTTEFSLMAKQCIADLNIVVSPEAVPEEEQEEPEVAVQVNLIDHTSRKVHVPKDATLEVLGERVAKQLRISNASDFTFFQMTEGLEMHRLLPENVAINKLQQKWEALKNTSGRPTELLYKRKFLRVDEGLLPGDLMHAMLTFRQALWDYLHYPILEDKDFVCEIAANILILEYDHFSEYIISGKLYTEGILEQLVPEVCLRQIRQTTQWSSQILARFHVLQDQVCKQETTIMKMSRTLTLLQRMKLFGSYYWMGKQQMTVPDESISIQDAPEQMVKINQKAPEAWYWICVDLFGVRFVSAESTPGKGFQRGFLFNEEAVERVLCWGAKRDHVQFVVMTVNPALPGAGRVPMTLALKSPAAVDISYAVHTVLSHLGMLPH